MEIMESEVQKRDLSEWDDDLNDQILLDCPFCGRKPKESKDNGMEVVIECENCGASIYRCINDEEIKKDYMKRCRRAWNRRIT